MSKEQLAAVILLGTFACVFVIAGGAALAEAEKRERDTRLTDFDPTGIPSMLLSFTRVVFYSLEWKKENRLALSLVGSGVACGFFAIVIACL